MRLLGPIVVLKPHGNLMGGDETDDLDRLIARYDREGVKCLVINLDEVSMMNSLGLGVLLSGVRRLGERGAKMSVCHVHERLAVILRAVKYAGPWFDTLPTQDAAIAGCASNE